MKGIHSFLLLAYCANNFKFTFAHSCQSITHLSGRPTYDSLTFRGSIYDINMTFETNPRASISYEICRSNFLQASEFIIIFVIGLGIYHLGSVLKNSFIT